MTLSDGFTITLTPRITVDLVDAMGNDLAVVKSARVSTVGADAEDSEESAGLINFLMKGRHGTPFEHNSMTFRVTAPLFVWREHHRHRVGFSYNEESGRYKQLDPVFYVPDPERALKQVGKAGAYDFVPGDEAQQILMATSLADNSWDSYERYQRMLDAGIAREVARMCLPVNVMSTCYVTCNARSLMNFLSLRTKDEESMFPSYPQREIEMVAEQYEESFADLFPLTYMSFVDNGRVGP